MNMSPTEIAQAFSQHEFTSTYDHLGTNIAWRNIGGDDHTGRDAVIAACREASDYFATVQSEIAVMRAFKAGDVIVVETIGTYVDSDGTSRVASCDLYEFVDGQVVGITSYNVELTT
jgi:limonene-1,2-epoxide hydrolase